MKKIILLAVVGVMMTSCAVSLSVGGGKKPKKEVLKVESTVSDSKENN